MKQYWQALPKSKSSAIMAFGPGVILFNALFLNCLLICHCAVPVPVGFVLREQY